MKMNFEPLAKTAEFRFVVPNGFPENEVPSVKIAPF